MKIFISWSGERSKKIAELLDGWLRCVIQASSPWISSRDIDRGALWFTEINEKLSSVTFGIVCLTKENKTKPWILFESGALAKGLSSNRVCTFLIDIDNPNDLENPLAQFNHTLPTKESVWSLVRTINIALQEAALHENVLDRVFETYWPQFEERFNEILKDTPDTPVDNTRQESDIMDEILSTVRMLNRRMRDIEKNQMMVDMANRELINLYKFTDSYKKNVFKHYQEIDDKSEREDITNKKLDDIFL